MRRNPRNDGKNGDEAWKLKSDHEQKKNGITILDQTRKAKKAMNSRNKRLSIRWSEFWDL